MPKKPKKPTPPTPTPPTKPTKSVEPFEIAGRKVESGTRVNFELPVARLATQNMVHLPIAVVHGRRKGPALFVTAALHGDELNGTEVARRLLSRVHPKGISGTLVVLPVVNVLGFINGSRYLPDRRDLNRSFPGAASGSLASQVARLVMTEVVERCDYGIDLHGGANHRTNLPQVRANMEEDSTRELALAFGAPIALHAKNRPGSLRGTASRAGVPTIVYEAGEPHRFEDVAVRYGLNGVLRVMAHLGMRRSAPRGRPGKLVGERTQWVRAPISGIARMLTYAGAHVAVGAPLVEIGDAFGDNAKLVRARAPGVVIGHTLNPIVNRGDALVNLALDLEGAPEA